MKTQKAITCVGLMVCLASTGCGLPRKVITPLQNGYSSIAYYGGYPHEYARGELQYREHKGQEIVVWPSLADVMINGQTAVFTGWAHGPSGPAYARFVFAFEPPGPAVEITQKILELKAKERGETLSQVPKSATIVTLKKLDNAVQFGIAVEEWPDPEVVATWSQISTFIREAKEKGVQRKDGLYGTHYLELLP